MPVGSFNPKDAYEVKGGFQEGWGEVVGAKSIIFQFPANKQTGEQSAPFTGVLLSIQRVDEAGKKLSAEPDEEILKVDKNLEAARPGNMASRTATDADDLGMDLGTEGNCIYTTEVYKFNKKSKFIVLCDSLVANGFKPEVLGTGFLPDLVGLRAHFKRSAPQKFKTDTGEEKDYDSLIVDKISRYPYEKSAAKATPAAKKAAPSQGTEQKLNGAPAPGPAEETTAAAPTGDTDSIDSIVIGILRLVSTENSGKEVPLNRMKALAYQKLMGNKDLAAAQKKAGQELIGNVDWLMEHAIETAVLIGPDGATASFLGE
jgi:hypothetical protein